jgi:hypothetical protein
MESRFSKNKVAPYLKVNNGDLIFVKKSGGSIGAFFLVKSTKYFDSILVAKKQIDEKYAKGICVDAVNDFWGGRMQKKYISLFEVGFLYVLKSKKIEKKDRMAWVLIG